MTNNDESYKHEFDKDHIYRLMFENSSSIMMLIDPATGNIVEANPAAVAYYGYTKDQLLSMRIQDINTLSEKQVKKGINLARKEKRSYFQFTHRLANNEERQVEVHSFPIKTPGGELLFSIVHDISDKLKQKLMFDSLFLDSPYAVAILDKKQRVVSINNNFCTLFQYTSEEVNGRFINEIVSPEEKREQVDNNIKSIYEGNMIKQEAVRKRKDGKLIDVEVLGYPVINHGEIIGVYIMYNDISDKKKNDRRMRDLMQKEPLTGLYNRNFFLETVDTYIKSVKGDKRFSIVFLDLDRLKDINDSLSHMLGDKLLIQLSKRLASLMNDNCILSRFDGSSFAVLYKDIAEEDEIMRFSKTLLDAVKKPFLIEGILLHVNAKIGISRFPEDGRSAESLVRYADIAASKAKDKLEDKICFYSKAMSREIENRFFITNHLMWAIPNNELTIHYQPIFDIEHHRNIVGAEALLRWYNPVLGLVMPDNFIPLAEKTGQILSIGEWVLEQVCKQISCWQSANYDIVPIAVNISVKQLERPGFSKMVKEIIDKYNISPRYIELEITESVSSGDIAAIVNNLKDLKKNGIKISMDDFGTGFSSLGQLDLFELDKLKIDKVFIDDLVSVIKKQNLVKSIISMAKSLHLLVIAEGIETHEQLRYLRQLGCQQGQGFLLSKPLPAGEIEMLLSADNG